MLFIALFGIISCDDKPRKTLIQAPKGIFDGSLNNNGTSAVIATVDRDTLFWDLEEKDVRYTWSHNDDPKSAITLTAISADGRFALTGEGYVLGLWLTHNGDLLRYISFPFDLIDITISNDGRLAAASLTDKSVVIVDLKSGEIIRKFYHDDLVNSVSLSSNKRLLLTGSDDFKATLWNLPQEEIIYSWEHSKAVNFVAISPNMKYALTSSNPIGAYVWDLQSGKQIAQLNPLSAIFRTIKDPLITISSAFFIESTIESAKADLFSNDFLLTGSPPGIISLWSLPEVKLQEQWYTPKRTFWKPAGNDIVSLAYNPKQEKIVAEGANGIAYWYDLPQSSLKP